jgi:UDP-N-acetyl-D-glucosamine dehydrogenase
MEKILENTFRNINIALANEMAILCHKMGIDVWEVIEAASSKPYGFMPFYPGPGLGGHCIPIDPWYLTWKAREFDYHTRLIETAGEINNSMPEFVLNRIADLLNQASKSVKGATVTLLGVAYKKDVSDYRESAVLKIIELLQSKGATVRTVDPHIAQFKLNGQMYSSEPLSSELLESSDLVVLTTNHSDFNYEWIANHHITIFDTRNAFKSAKGKAIIERL